MAIFKKLLVKCSFGTFWGTFMAKQILPIFPSHHGQLSEKISVQCINEQVGYFYGLHPLYNHNKNDIDSFKVTICQLYHNNYCSQSQIIEFFQVSPRGVKRAYQVYLEHGPGKFFTNRPKRKGKHTATVFTPELIKVVQEKLDDGVSKKEIAEAFDIKMNTFDKAIQSGRLVKKKVHREN